ncbi:coniferyl aldehyde dehydrogenase [Pantoea phytobeneficialis]|uniref:Aldehyde dehydrogenase n=1 Tax=Pantoea phytobeneficialis TaxID=2052056 RepID=A0AAP9HBN2_9GAMM|nr:coniferyl aldehyde dehydrogenase [Pantoea phytobeneficialis]MDO6409684.1 coniferyl aldehyde dehydrogenase [Pantoea phytobeneficialis]QGR10022.1 coniferyl aldehyde dehydrogenase [Pantoea phytobeneficialis]
MNATQHDQQLLHILHSMKNAHLQAGPASAALRRDRLLRSIALIRDNHAAIANAISADFGHRSAYQTMAADLVTTINMLQHSADNLESWMAAESADVPVAGMQAWIVPQPLGVVGIISPWNFPINLAFGPLAGVFAAGNTAMLKPSELTPKTSELLAELVARYFDPQELTVVLGDADVGQAFSRLPFDHLVFTGSTNVGKHVMRAAAENLVPVTLELGGKSPVVVDVDADPALAAARTLTIKTFNAGQICISPDYLLLPEGAEDAFVTAARSFMQQAFPTVQSNPDYTAIISDRHYQRLINLLEDAQNKGARIISLAPEGEPAFDADSRKIAPHLILAVTEEMAVMQEEIFGPLLPVKTWSTSVAEAIDYINAHPRPLAAYYFGNDAQRQQQMAQRTTSGALVINDVMTHASLDSLPFGGVGASGTGAYHGIHGFRRFSHAKPVVVQDEAGTTNLRLRAPYQDKMALLTSLLDQQQ